MLRQNNTLFVTNMLPRLQDVLIATAAIVAIDLLHERYRTDMASVQTVRVVFRTKSAGERWAGVAAGAGVVRL